MRGLVLEGGGAKGAYQVGACRALQEMGVEFKGVAGTSIGAINGAIIAQGDLEKAYEIWSNISLNKLFDVREEYLEALRKFELNQETWSYFLDWARDILNNRGLDTALMKQILQENIDEDKLRRSGIVFGLVTVSLTDRQPLELFLEDIPQGQLVNYLMASASLPIFKLEKIGDKQYLDGGFYNNLPVSLLYSRGFRDILAIRTHGLGRIRKLNAPDLQLTVIEPQEDLGAILDFSQEGARRNLLMGYYDARKALQGLRGREFYLEPGPTEDDYIQLLLRIDEDAILAGAQVLGLKKGSPRRILFEELVPRILELQSWPVDRPYEGVVLLLCEALAKKYELERFRIYTFAQFLDVLAEKHKKAGDNEPQPLARPELARYNLFLYRLRRGDLLERLAIILLDKVLRER